MWEKGGYFKPKIDPKKKPFTILLPPPNASGRMHTGNVLMIAIEDLLVRYHRMKGDPTLWIPGTDHAGTETQITYERELKKEGKSRFNFTRKQLYQNIWEFVHKNKGIIEGQIRQMGASVDWSRAIFTLDPKVVATVHNTFAKMYEDGLVYRGEYMVNYCPKCGTTYADVEISHKERNDPLYFIKYEKLNKADGEAYISVATVRPEPIAEDTHLAVHPEDKKHKGLIGEKVLNPLTGAEMEIIGDEFVDPKFGTGIVKLTPAVDKNDYEVALKHKLPINDVMDLNGKMKGRYEGLSVIDARKKAMEELEQKGLVAKVDEKYTHSVAICKAGHDIEPMIMPNWFVAVDKEGKSFKKPALEAVKSGKVKIFPKWQEIKYIRWMEEMYDWPISRQNVWGIQIPVLYEVENDSQFYVWFTNKNGEYKHGQLGQMLKEVTFEEITEGLQRVFALPEVKWVLEKDKEEGKTYLPETDTFDTWFSSGQWPLVTLGYPDSEDFKYFYPTSVLETGWEIIRLWVSRMVMFGIYLTGEAPFEYVYLHGIVKALDGRKMSKSLGNVINPEEYIEQYGVDALRMGLISGTANGKDFSFPKDRVIAYKHFANKIWNMARFMLMMQEQYGKEVAMYTEDIQVKPEDKEILKSLATLIKSVDTSLEKFRMADAAEAIYQFMWHELADKYIEQVKNREDKDIALSVLRYVYTTSLKLLHPFMPFVTEEVWGELSKEEPLIIQPWPLA